MVKKTRTSERTKQFLILQNKSQKIFFRQKKMFRVQVLNDLVFSFLINTEVLYLTHQWDRFIDTQRLAGSLGFLDLLQFVVNECSWYLVPVSICIDAASHGHLHLLKWMKKHGYFRWDVRICSSAAGNGHFKIVRWAWKGECEWSESISSEAAKNGHLKILKWVIKHGCLWNNTTWVFGHFAVFKWAILNDRTSGYNACSYAASTGNLKMLKFIHKHKYGRFFGHEVAFQAVKNGRLKVMKWAYKHGCQVNIDAALMYLHIGD